MPVVMWVVRHDVRVEDMLLDARPYSLDAAPQVMSIDESGEIRWSAPAAVTYRIRVSVSDGCGTSVVRAYTMTVK